MFSYENCKVLRNIIFTEQCSRLILLSYDIFNVSLALSLINKFSHSIWRYNISIISVLYLALSYYISIILVLILVLYYYISIIIY